MKKKHKNRLNIRLHIDLNFENFLHEKRYGQTQCNVFKPVMDFDKCSMCLGAILRERKVLVRGKF